MDDEFRKVNDEAIARAARVLKGGFDSEAFMVYSIACMNRMEPAEQKAGQVDAIPDSGVDESISGLLQSFVRYHNGDRSELQNVLNEIRQIISELYHTAEDHDARAAICNFVNGLGCFQK